MKKVIPWLLLLAALVAIALFSFHQNRNRTVPTATPVPEVSPSPSTSPSPTPHPTVDSSAERRRLEKEFQSQLVKPNASARTLDVPTPLPVESEAPKPEIPPAVAVSSKQRKERQSLPLGVVLFDGIPFYSSSTGNAVLYKMRTGDFLRVYSESGARVHVHPGVDIFLALTDKSLGQAGLRYPDRDGWVETDSIYVFPPEQAVEFTQTTDAMTVGPENFSMSDFYDRALNNPDSVVHKIAGPRLIALLSLHEEYGDAWFRLYRDPDPKIRSLALAKLQERGIKGSHVMIDDLLARLSELTSRRAEGESEQEALMIVDLLKKSHDARAFGALQNFRSSWKGFQSAQLINALPDENKKP